MKLSNLDKEKLIELFNRGGYVLDFNTEQFNNFTSKIIGIPLCSKYGVSKGKSLERFTFEYDDKKIIDLYTQLIERYEYKFFKEIEEKDENYYHLYLDVKKIINRKNINNFEQYSQKVQTNFNSEYLNSQFTTLLSSMDCNPTEAIGKAKELIESCCKTILENYGENYKNLELNKLVKQTQKVLGITSESIGDTYPEAEKIKQILNNLVNITDNVSTLRNYYGSGHGKVKKYKGLNERHARLVVGSSLTVVTYLWDTFEWKQNPISK